MKRKLFRAVILITSTFANAQNAGIGTATPNAPLHFSLYLGKKVTHYPGTTGNAGMAVQGNLLQIYSDNPNADIDHNYDQAGVFMERFRVQANGALAVIGHTGAPGHESGFHHSVKKPSSHSFD